MGPKIAADALKDHPGKLRILATTAPVPGFAISLSRSMPQAQAKKITEALLTIGQNPSGKAALAAISVGQAAGNTTLNQTTSEEYVKAMRLISSAKQLYPPLLK